MSAKILNVVLAILAALTLALMMNSVGFSQNTGALAPEFAPVIPLLNGTGPNALGFICTFAAGTTTIKYTYQDSALTTDNQNPIRLNAAGRPVNGSTLVSIYLGQGVDGNGALNYKMTVYAAGTGNSCNGTTVGTLIRSVDNVADLAQLMLTLNNTWTGNNTFSNGFFVVSGSTTTALYTSINNREFCIPGGTNYGTELTAAAALLPSTGGSIDCSNLQGAQTIASDVFTGQTKPLTVIWPTGTVSSAVSLTIPATMTVDFPEGGILSMAVSTTATINGEVRGTMSQHFAGSGNVVFPAGTATPIQYSQWFASPPYPSILFPYNNPAYRLQWTGYNLLTPATKVPWLSLNVSPDYPSLLQLLTPVASVAAGGRAFHIPEAGSTAPFGDEVTEFAIYAQGDISACSTTGCQYMNFTGLKNKEFQINCDHFAGSSGYSGVPCKFRAGGVTAMIMDTTSGTMTLPSTIYLSAYETGGTSRGILEMDGSNHVHIGDGNNIIQLNAKSDAAGVTVFVGATSTVTFDQFGNVNLQAGGLTLTTSTSASTISWNGDTYITRGAANVLWVGSSSTTYNGTASLGDSTHIINGIVTNTVDIRTGGSTTISTGVGSVKMSTANPATNTSWVPIYYAGTIYYVPGWATNAP